MNTTTVKDLLADGFEIHYAPVSGGLLFMKNGQRADAAHSIAMCDFLDLRANNTISMYREWRSTHPIMHGLVCGYKLAQS